MGEKSKKSMVIITWIALMFLLCACNKSTENKQEIMIINAVTPAIENAIIQASDINPLSDLSYRIVIDNIYDYSNPRGSNNSLEGIGDIIFISNEIEKYSPAEMYQVMRTLSARIFPIIREKQGTSRIRLNWYHNDGVSTWETSDGVIYIAYDAALLNAGTPIYNNPDYVEDEGSKALREIFSVPSTPSHSKSSTSSEYLY